jgi:hypothetical protein
MNDRSKTIWEDVGNWKKKKHLDLFFSRRENLKKDNVTNFENILEQI